MGKCVDRMGREDLKKRKGRSQMGWKGVAEVKLKGYKSEVKDTITGRKRKRHLFNDEIKSGELPLSAHKATCEV